MVPAPPMPTAPAMPAAPVKPIPSPRLDPDWPVDLRLEGGKRVRATVVPGIARKKDVADLARVTDTNNQRTFAELNRQRKAIARLRKAQADLARQVTALQQQADQAMVRVLDGIRGFDQQFKTVQAQNQQLVTSIKTSRAVAAQQGRKCGPDRRLARPNRQRCRRSVQAAAYGERGSLSPEQPHPRGQSDLLGLSWSRVAGPRPHQRDVGEHRRRRRADWNITVGQVRWGISNTSGSCPASRRSMASRPGAAVTRRQRRERILAKLQTRTECQ